MKKIAKKILIIMLFAFILLTSTGCWNNESNLLGIWICEDDGSAKPFAISKKDTVIDNISYNTREVHIYISETESIPAGKIEFLKDKTGTISTYGMTWKTENDRLYFNIASGLRAFSCDYKISGATLTITDFNGNDFVYKKQ